jgi:phospholipid-translocating ATPase
MNAVLCHDVITSFNYQTD